MEAKPGTYILLLQSSVNIHVSVGRWGELELQPGYYLYVGSAFGPGGVRARVARHCRPNKAKRWHVDYLREHTSLKEIWYSFATVHLEHQWAAFLAEMNEMLPIKGFGSSDCKCLTHLYFCKDLPEHESFVESAKQTVMSVTCGQLDS